MSKVTTHSEPITSTLAGVAGEYFVAAELSRLGFIASITLRNTKGIDILASSGDGSRQVGIQVKTNQKNKWEWVLNQKAENYFAENLYYIFVTLKNKGVRPDYFIVPSKEVAEFITETHREWLHTPGKKGQPHMDNNVRVFRDAEGKFLERWDILGLDNPK